jgi:hypothetical protein
MMQYCFPRSLGEEMNRDRYDLPLTTASDRAAASYRDGVDRLLSAWHGADHAFDRAIIEDPDFALAHIARARVHQLHMESVEARAKAAHARRLAVTATRRERRHVEILAAAIEGQPRAALAGAEQHLDEFPRDARYSVSCWARSACTHSRAVPTTMRRGSRFASVTPGTMARIGGS